MLCSRKGALLGIGNALLDITVHVDQAFLNRHQIGVNEAVRGDITKHAALLQELASRDDVRRTAGGSGLNVLRAAQWVLGQPDVCTFIGCIGNDENGRLLLQSANEAGVQPICQVVDDPTSVCVVLVTDVERSMCSFQNASGKFDFQQFLQKQTQEIFERASIIYLSGFFLNVCITTAKYVAEKACESGKKFVLDLGAPRIVKGQAETFKILLPFAEVVFGNDAEFAALGEVLGLETVRVEEVCLCVAGLSKAAGTSGNGRTVVMTRGKDPVVVVNSNELIFFPCVPLPSDQIVDVNGAGDAFLGGFLAKYLDNSPIPECVASGLSLSRLVIQNTGCSFS